MRPPIGWVHDVRGTTAEGGAMKVKELMTTEVRTVSIDTPLKEVAAILAGEGISGLPVVDPAGGVVGVVSEADILYKERPRPPRRSGPLAVFFDGAVYDAVTKAAARTAGEAMTAPPITIGPDRVVAEAARLMTEHDVNRLPVVKGDELVGIVTRADLVRAFTRADEEIMREIREEVLRRALWLEPEAITVDVLKGEVALAGQLEGRSDVQLLQALVERVPGVVGVRSEVTWRVDDTKRRRVPAR
jgi:CBS domain-containing protein